MEQMNELQYRQKILQNPQQLDEETLAFLEKNPEKIKVAKAYKEFDDLLIDVINIKPPEGLQERILLKNAFEVPAANDAKPKWFRNVSAFAASFLVVALSVGLWQNPNVVQFDNTELSFVSEEGDIQKAVVDHIIEHAKEAPEIMVDYANLNETELDAIFTQVGASLNTPIDFMSYAGECEVAGITGLHVVLQEESGPVTIIVLPGQYMTTMKAFKDQHFQGQMIPVNGAVVAIVGKSEEQVAMAQMHFFKAVDFS